MNTQNFKLIVAMMLFSCFTFANEIVVKGVVTEKHNSGFRMAGVEVQVIDATTQSIQQKIRTDELGRFSIELPLGKNYEVVLNRKNFLPCVRKVNGIEVAPKSEVFFEMKMERKPGYVFDVTLMDGKENGTAFLNTIQGARIEIYNNTTRKSELVLEEHPSELFEFVFESGNYYTLMIRKKGYFNKRIEAYIDIEGCILCFDGLDIQRPEFLGETTADNNRGAFLAEIEMQPIEINKEIEIENIYYDFDQSFIRKDAAQELDKLTSILRDNQHVLLELGSHTDARGNDDYNMKLSKARAKAAVKYLTAKAGIANDRMTWRGYGESQLINDCDNGIECPEELHQNNRRTTLKIMGLDDDPLDKKSLKEIIENGEKHLLISQSN